MTNTRERITSCLLDGLRTAVQIGERLALDASTVRRELHKMAEEGVAELVPNANRYEWHLRESARAPLNMSEPQPSTEPPNDHTRVQLAEELVEIERLLVEMTSRRAEILEKLR